MPLTKDGRGDVRSKEVLRELRWAALVGILPIWLMLAAGMASPTEGDGATGRVVDAQTGEAIVGAAIFEAIPEERLSADVRRFDDVRVTQSEADGRFRFPPRKRGAFTWFFSSERAPRYHVYHESYGLVWGREGAGRIELSLHDAHLRSADARRLCQSREEDELHVTVRARACPPARPDRFADGRPRATGTVDARGRRTGPWRFFREDGSLHAQGSYVDGAADRSWVFHPRTLDESN